MNAPTSAPLRPIKPVAFVAALSLAPLVLGVPCLLLLTLAIALGLELPALFVALLVPVYAVLFGAVPYLLFGTPAFVFALRWRKSLPGAAFLANLVAAPAIFLAFLIPQGAEDAVAAAGLVLFFGSMAAPIWGGFFEWLYNIFAGRSDA